MTTGLLEIVIVLKLQEYCRELCQKDVKPKCLGKIEAIDR